MSNNPNKPAMPDFARIERESSLQQIAFEKVQEALMSGRFRPGQRISIRKLAEALGISPMPVREALRRLEAKNALVPVGPGRALMVPFLGREELHEIRDIRIAIEGMAAEQAVPRMSADEIEEAGRLCREMDGAAKRGDFAEYLEKNRAFHFAIYRAARRPLSVAIIESMWLRIGPFLNLFLDDPAHLENSMVHHWVAEEGIRTGNAAQVRRAIVDDIAEAAADLERFAEGP